MKINDFIALVNRTDWNKYQKEDILDLVKDHPEFLDMTPVQLKAKARDLYWEAEGLFDRVNSLENEASLIRDLIEIIHGE